MSTFNGTYENRKGELIRMRFARQKDLEDTTHVSGFLRFANTVRDHFGQRLDLKGVEVGAHLGEATLMLLSVCDGMFESYTIVDLWKNKRCMDRCKENLKPWDDIVKLDRTGSAVGHIMFEDQSLDFIYIDARHEYKYVSKDLEWWLPKLKPGGIIAGHDFEDNPKWGVIKAVTEAFPNRTILTFPDTSWLVKLT